MAKAGRLLIEQYENYPRQTYRNRCYIYSANGVLPLVVPVERGSFHKVLLKDIKIDNSRKWQREHLHAIRSAYNSSAFFEFYSDEVLKPLKSVHIYLLDLNMSILETLLKVLELDLQVEKTNSFRKQYTEDEKDMRYNQNPKSEYVFNAVEYFQVFSPRFGFRPNLSILDLIFNMGPEAWSCLRT